MIKYCDLAACKTAGVIVGLLVLGLACPVRAQAPGEPPTGSPPGEPPGQAPGSSTSATYYATYKLDGGTATQSNQSWSASATDTSGVWVTNSGALTLIDCTITTTGNTSSADSSSFVGLNAGVLAAAGTINMQGGSVITSGTGANGVFATGAGASVSLANVTIDATGNGGHAVMATQGGSLTCTNVSMTTAGANSGAIATDRGGGTITVTGGTVTATGRDSPGIYSTGAISVSGGTITATGAESAVIEGANSINLTDTALSSSYDGKWGVMIYQSMSGDATGSEGVFTMTGGSLANTAPTGPLFFVTNATGTITLRGVEVTVGSGVLVEAGGTDRWGTSGSNGGQAILVADGQILNGNLVTDDTISSISATLKNGSRLTGSINSGSLSIDATSTWTVTADSRLTSLSDAAGISGTSITNITGNGHTVYYDASLDANSALGGQTYSLAGGGQLTPQSGTNTTSTTNTVAMCGSGIVGLLPLTAVVIVGMTRRTWKR